VRLRGLAAGALSLALVGCEILGMPSRDFEVPDLDGKRHAPLLSDGRSCTVLVFIATDCPIANAYVPELREIAALHGADPIRLYLVHSDPALDLEAARVHASAFRLPGTVLLDQEQRALRAAGATTTPEAVVYDRRGMLTYRGRIDDWYADLGVKRQAATTHELRDAIAAALRGEEPAVRHKEPVGCLIALR
jgi:hypothetical protein